MTNRADQIRKQLQKRRQTHSSSSSSKPKDSLPLYQLSNEREYAVYEADPSERSDHPLFNKGTFLLKILASCILVLVIAIVYKSSTPQALPIQQFVKQTMTSEFQFAAVSAWYEERFGEPLAILPKLPTDNPEATVTQDYSTPASGRVVKEFSEQTKGVLIETTVGANVEAMKGGQVIFVGQKEGIGNTVIIQHEDKTTSWYGGLSDMTVSPYERIESGRSVGFVSDKEQGDGGTFYFAIEQGGSFIDPIQVIPFE